MQFTGFTTLASLAIGSYAAVIPRQGTSNPRLAQFRVFSQTGCFALNEGFYTIDTDQANVCHDLYSGSSSTPNGYVSIELEATTDAAANCELLLYSDRNCTQTETVSPLDTCEDASVVQEGATYPTWNSYYYKCGA